MKTNLNDFIEESISPTGQVVPTFQPALEFDRKHGTHVGRRYRLPDGYDETKLEAEVMSGSRARSGNFTPGKGVRQLTVEETKNIAVALVSMNPELMGCLPADPSEDDCYHLILGVTSGFNPRDIAHFRHHNSTDMSAKIHYNNWVKDQTGFSDIQWIPSPETVEDIRQQTGALSVAGTAVSESYRRLPPVQVGEGMLVWVYHWVTGTPVMARVTGIVAGQALLSFDFDDSPLAGAPECRVRRASVIGPYRP